MGKRLDKLQKLNEIATRLEFSPLSRAKLLLGTYMNRLRTRIPSLPTPVFNVKFPYEGRTVSYFFRTNDVDFQFLDHLFLRRDYEVPFKSPKRILDLGGNIGSADIFFRCAYPEAEIVTVEPLPDNQVILRKNWAANSIRGHIIAGAASNQAGRAKFYVGAPDCSSLVARDDLADGCIEVDCVTIPQILEKAGWDGIDVMKVDIEGGEIALFKDSSQWAGKVGVIVAELHDGYSVEDVDRDLGYQFDCTQTFEFPPPYTMKVLLAVRKNLPASSKL